MYNIVENQDLIVVRSQPRPGYGLVLYRYLACHNKFRPWMLIPFSSCWCHQCRDTFTIGGGKELFEKCVRNRFLKASVFFFFKGIKTSEERGLRVHVREIFHTKGDVEVVSSNLGFSKKIEAAFTS